MTSRARTREPWPVRMAEAGLVPEAAVRWGIRLLCRKRLRDLEASRAEGALERLVEELRREPIAPDPEAANRQRSWPLIIRAWDSGIKPCFIWNG